MININPYVSSFFAPLKKLSEELLACPTVKKEEMEGQLDKCLALTKEQTSALDAFLSSIETENLKKAPEVVNTAQNIQALIDELKHNCLSLQENLRANSHPQQISEKVSLLLELPAKIAHLSSLLRAYWVNFKLSRNISR